MNNWLNNSVEGMPYLAVPVPVHDLLPNFAGVYAIKWADGSAYEYVGQARCLRHRFSAHEHGFVNCVFEVLQWGYKDGLDMDDLTDRVEAESYFIRKFIREGYDLVNNCHIARKTRRSLFEKG